MGSSWDDLGVPCSRAAVGILGSLFFNPERKQRGGVLSEKLPVKIRASNMCGALKVYIGLCSQELMFVIGDL